MRNLRLNFSKSGTGLVNAVNATQDRILKLNIQPMDLLEVSKAIRGLQDQFLTNSPHNSNSVPVTTTSFVAAQYPRLDHPGSIVGVPVR